MFKCQMVLPSIQAKFVADRIGKCTFRWVARGGSMEQFVVITGYKSYMENLSKQFKDQYGVELSWTPYEDVGRRPLMYYI